MSLDRQLKGFFHGDVVRNPEAHAWVLNLYLAGERYPKQASDYFQAELVEDPELASKLREHSEDEARHERMLVKTLGLMGQPVIELQGQDIYNEAIRAETPVGFRLSPEDDRAERDRKLGHFLLHLHFLESRVARSLEYHADACFRAGSDMVGNVIERVLHDERQHAAYTVEIARDLLPLSEWASARQMHRRAEARANVEFSRRQVRKFNESYSRDLSRPRRWAYRFYLELLAS